MCHTFEDVMKGTRCDKSVSQCCFKNCEDKETCKNVCTNEHCICNTDIRDVEQELWGEFLDINCCRADEVTGNRACDDGYYCDKCQCYEYQKGFDNWKKQAKAGYTYKRICKDLAEAMRCNYERYANCTNEECIDIAETFGHSPRSILRDLDTEITEVEYHQLILERANDISDNQDADEILYGADTGGIIEGCSCGGVGCYLCDDNIRGFKLND